MRFNIIIKKKEKGYLRDYNLSYLLKFLFLTQARLIRKSLLNNKSVKYLQI